MTKKKLFFILGSLIIILAVVYKILDYSAILKKNNLNIFTSPAKTYKIEEVARNLSVPWGIVFTSPDRLLITERRGTIRVIENGELLGSPIANFPEASTSSEEGLMGIAKAPSYPQTKHIFVCLAYRVNDIIKNRIIRFEDRGTEIANSEVIIDDLPAAQYHAGCRLFIDKDEKLFVTVGDATDKQLAQDKNSLAGKILRYNLDGTIPKDNPFPRSAIWTLGHRNSQGLAWDDLHSILWSSEHGPSLFDGPAGGDEINLIEKGKNYGWPEVSHEKTKDGFENPLIVFTPALAPASLAYYNNDIMPFFKNSLFFGALNGEGLYKLTLNENPRTKPSLEKINEVNFGRIREVAISPDGLIYFSTSNSDGRGEIREGDDKIYRLVPQY